MYARDTCAHTLRACVTGFTSFFCLLEDGEKEIGHLGVFCFA